MVRSFVEAISMTEQIPCSILRRWTAEGGCPHMSQNLTDECVCPHTRENLTAEAAVAT